MSAAGGGRDPQSARCGPSEPGDRSDLDTAANRLCTATSGGVGVARFRNGLVRAGLLRNTCEVRAMSSYSLWVMEFAHVPNYPYSGLVYGAHNEGTRRLPYCYILIKGQGKVAMVDVGYNHKA